MSRSGKGFLALGKQQTIRLYFPDASDGPWVVCHRQSDTVTSLNVPESDFCFSFVESLGKDCPGDYKKAFKAYCSERQDGEVGGAAFYLVNGGNAVAYCVVNCDECFVGRASYFVLSDASPAHQPGGAEAGGSYNADAAFARAAKAEELGRFASGSVDSNAGNSATLAAQQQRQSKIQQAVLRRSLKKGSDVSCGCTIS